MPEPTTVPVVNQAKQPAGEITLPAGVFDGPVRSHLLYEVVNMQRANRRAGTSSTKTRGAVSGGGKKPWKQKGTGRARHGSSRSPIWVGGGVTHGPLAEKNYKRKISKSMRAQALFSVLSKKLKDGEIIFVDSLAPSKINTKAAVDVMKSLAKTTKLNIAP